MLSLNLYRDWNQTMLINKDLTNEISIYLLSIGNEISGEKLCNFINSEDVRSRHRIDYKITIWTAQHYLKALGYQYWAPTKGQYADGHKHKDIVFYQEQIFLPQWRNIEQLMYNWDEDNLPELRPRPPGHWVIAWFHDESIFYAHDQHCKVWIHKDALAKPYAKGEGVSMMVADYMSADFRWLWSPNGSRSAWQILKPGENRDGYFTNKDIQAQVQEAIVITFPFHVVTSARTCRPAIPTYTDPPRSCFRIWLIISAII